MTLSPHARSAAADLLRLGAAWLALVVLVQGMAAAIALGAGPLHHHVASARSQPAVYAKPQAHMHADAERHHHAAADVGVVADAAEPAFEAAAFAITAALALMALALPRPPRDTRRHVLHSAPGWAWRVASPALLSKPPRRA